MVSVIPSTTVTDHGRRGDVYAIPMRGVPLEMVRYFVRVFLAYSRAHPSDTFRLDLKGCRLTVRQIAPLFDYAPLNVRLPEEFYHGPWDKPL